MRKFKQSLKLDDLENYLFNQLINYLPDNIIINRKILKDCVSIAIKRIEICFENNNNKYYGDENNIYFNHLNGDHYPVFLYFVSNNAFNFNDEILATKVFMLNKMMFGLDVFYKVKLPKHFMLVHATGTILGNASYGENLVVYQGVTIGSALVGGKYPIIGENTILYSNSSILGDCSIKDNFVLGANSSLINTNIESNKIVMGYYPNNKILDNENNFIRKYFNKTQIF